LALLVGLAQFAAAAVANVAGEAVAALAAVELDEDAPPEVLVVAVVEEVNRLWARPMCWSARASVARWRVWLRSARTSWLEVVWRCSRLPAILSTSS